MIRYKHLIPLVFGVILIVSACGTTPEEVPETPEIETPLVIENIDAPPEVVQTGSVRQWGITAQASTSYADPFWGAEQATGRPNTGRCGDIQTAWASSGSDAIDWLEVEFENVVHVTAVNIHQTFNPNQVTKVELLTPLGTTETIYDSAPVQVDQPCPYVLSIEIPKTRIRYNTVRITIDQSVLGLGWNEIDAVELVGDLE